MSRGNDQQQEMKCAWCHTPKFREEWEKACFLATGLCTECIDNLAGKADDRWPAVGGLILVYRTGALLNSTENITLALARNAQSTLVNGCLRMTISFEPTHSQDTFTFEAIVNSDDTTCPAQFREVWRRRLYYDAVEALAKEYGAVWVQHPLRYRG